MHSCIYEGTVAHRRFAPIAHKFQYRIFMVWLDLDEIPSLVGPSGLIANRRFASRSFRRSDHMFDGSQPLAAEVREFVRLETGVCPGGPIRLLTQLRCFGVFFSPLNLYFFFDDAGARVECVVAEVNNTPWNERHGYVLWQGNRVGQETPLRFRHGKEFHVSPFMDMEMEYCWQISPPGPDLRVHLVSRKRTQTLFDAQLDLQRRDISRAQLRRMTIRYPIMGATVLAAIYFQALKLWWKRCPTYVHPRKTDRDAIPPLTTTARRAKADQANPQ